MHARMGMLRERKTALVPLVAVALCALTVTQAGQLSAPVVWSCWLPSHVHIRPDDTCADFGAIANGSATVSMAMARNEYEAFQIMMVPTQPFTTVTVTTNPFSSCTADSADPVEGMNMTAQAVGFVFTQTTTRYAGSGGGWRPDPLLDIGSGIAINNNTAQSLWMEVHADASVPAGTYCSSITINLDSAKTSFSVQVEVFDATVPSLQDSTIGTAWSGSWLPDYFAPFYNDAYDSHQWFDLLLEHRMPPDSIYSPRNITDFGYLKQHGVKWLAVLDASSIGSSETRYQGSPSNGACPNVTDDFVQKALDTLSGLMAQLDAENASDVAYVYGFDEAPMTCAPQVRKLYSAIKAKFPGLRIAATLNWNPMPVDMPFDIWVMQYEEFDPQQAYNWTAAGKEQWWYHCIEPSGLNFLNTFIEHTLIQDRLLFWLAAQSQKAHKSPSGWLYYAVDLWRAAPGQVKKVIGRVNNTAYTDFDPANYIWSPRTDIFANGDGQYLYPGPNGPVRTVRLATIRDGLEDWELFQQLDATTVQQITQQMVNGPTDWSQDPGMLVKLRRQLLTALAASKNAY